MFLLPWKIFWGEHEGDNPSFEMFFFFLYGFPVVLGFYKLIRRHSHTYVNTCTVVVEAECLSFVSFISLYITNIYSSTRLLHVTSLYAWWWVSECVLTRLTDGLSISSSPDFSYSHIWCLFFSRPGWQYWGLPSLVTFSGCFVIILLI